MEQWNQQEAQILLWMQENIRIEILDAIMPFLSMINNAGILAMLTVVVLLVWKRYRYVGAAAFVSLGVEFLLVNVLIKPLAERVRPFYENESLQLLGSLPSDFSFPSGHTGSAFAVAVVMLLCMPKKYGITAVVVASFIAFSRLYNAAHYPTDVLAALMIGTLTAVAASKIVYPWIMKRKEGSNSDQKQI